VNKITSSAYIEKEYLTLWKHLD